MHHDIVTLPRSTLYQALRSFWFPAQVYLTPAPYKEGTSERTASRTRRQREHPALSGIHQVPGSMHCENIATSR